MLTFGVASNATLRALFSTFGSQWQHVSTMATPIGSYISDGFEAMGNAVIESVFVSVLVGIGLGYTFGNHLRKALSMACVLTIFTLITTVHHEFSA